MTNRLQQCMPIPVAASNPKLHWAISDLALRQTMPSVDAEVSRLECAFHPLTLMNTTSPWYSSVCIQIGAKTVHLWKQEIGAKPDIEKLERGELKTQSNG